MKNKIDVIVDIICISCGLSINICFLFGKIKAAFLLLFIACIGLVLMGVYILWHLYKRKGLKPYKCTNCKKITYLKNNGEITAGHCKHCGHPVWN